MSDKHGGLTATELGRELAQEWNYIHMPEKLAKIIMTSEGCEKRGKHYFVINRQICIRTVHRILHEQAEAKAKRKRKEKKHV
jgi:hypothetical protein